MVKQLISSLEISINEKTFRDRGSGLIMEYGIVIIFYFIIGLGLWFLKNITYYYVELYYRRIFKIPSSKNVSDWTLYGIMMLIYASIIIIFVIILNIF